MLCFIYRMANTSKPVNQYTSIEEASRELEEQRNKERNEREAKERREREAKEAREREAKEARERQAKERERQANERNEREAKERREREAKEARERQAKERERQAKERREWVSPSLPPLAPPSVLLSSFTEIGGTVFYNVRIQNAPTDAPTNLWMRYSQFVTLHNSMGCMGSSRPALPGKWFGTSPDARCISLREYLQNLLENTLSSDYALRTLCQHLQEFKAVSPM
jgi:phage-related minor tail protein